MVNVHFVEIPRIFTIQHFANFIKLAIVCNYFITNDNVFNRNSSAFGVYNGFRIQTLIHIFCRMVKHAQHGNNSIRTAVRSTNVTARGAHIVNMETNATCPLGNIGAILQGIVDTVDTVTFHG